PRPSPVTVADRAAPRGSTRHHAAARTVSRRPLQPHRPRAAPHWTRVTVPGSSMRVLMITHGFPPAATGGTEIYTHDLARTLHETFGHDVHILTREADAARPEYAVRRERRDGLSIVDINNKFARCRSVRDRDRRPD